MTVTQLSSRALNSLHHLLHPGSESGANEETVNRRAAIPVDGTRFRAALANAYHRAADLQTDLAVIFIRTRDCPAVRQDQIAGLLLTFTRADGALFLPSEMCFALILPGMGPATAALFSLEILRRLQDQYPNTCFKLSTTGYPGKSYYS